MAAVVACRSLNNCVLNTVAKTRIKSRSGHYLFAAIASAVALLFVIIICRGIPKIESADVLQGIVLGIIAIGEEFFLLSALECGSVSMTMIVALTSFSITHMAGVPLWGHGLNALDWAGIIISIACIFVLLLDCFNRGIESAYEKKEFSHWRKHALILLVFTALIEIAEKTHAETAVSGNHMGYYFVAFLTGTILAGSLFLWRYKGKKEPTQFVWDGKFILMLLFCGIMKALIYIVAGLAAAELTEELVSIINSCVLIVVLIIIDILYFKAKLRLNNYIAAIMAISAILLMW